MAQHEQTLAIYASISAQRRERGNRIVGCFIINAEVAIKILGARTASLVVSKYCDTLRGETARDVQEGPIGSNGFVTILRS